MKSTFLVYYWFHGILSSKSLFTDTLLDSLIKNSVKSTFLLYYWFHGILLSKSRIKSVNRKKKSWNEHFYYPIDFTEFFQLFCLGMLSKFEKFPNPIVDIFFSHTVVMKISWFLIFIFSLLLFISRQDSILCRNSKSSRNA